MYEGPGLYQHYKGGHYVVAGLSCDADTHKQVVIYTKAVYTKEDFGTLVASWEDVRTEPTSFVRARAEFDRPAKTAAGGLPVERYLKVGS